MERIKKLNDAALGVIEALRHLVRVINCTDGEASRGEEITPEQLKAAAQLVFWPWFGTK
jgi:hypothetical protein